jgi:hypothetical protein
MLGAPFPGPNNTACDSAKISTICRTRSSASSVLHGRLLLGQFIGEAQVLISNGRVIVMMKPD